MLGVSVSRETLTPNAGYVVGILLRRPPAARQAALRAGGQATRRAWCAKPCGQALAQLAWLPLGEHAGASQDASGYWAS